jgi:hypothetical protein
MQRDSYSYFFLLNFIVLIFIFLYLIHKYYYTVKESKIIYNNMAYSSN